MPVPGYTGAMSRFRGMTTLDRLAAAGLLADFEEAVKRAARKAAVDMLVSVEIPPNKAFEIYEGAVQIKKRLGA